MPKHLNEKFSPNAENSDKESAIAQNHSTPARYATLPEETEKLQDSISSEDVEPHFQSGGCCYKYSNALKGLLPFRLPRKDKTKLPSNKAGLISFFSLTWLTTLMWKAYKKGLEPEDLWDLQDDDCAAFACARINRLWMEEESDAKQKDVEPELWRAVWRSSRTRILVSIFISFLTNILQFLGPSIFLKMILDYINDPEIDHLYGTYIVLGVLLVNLVRGAFFSWMFVLSIHTATRVVGGIQSLVYRKILKLKTGGEKLSAQITNILTNDMERLFEAVVSSAFLTVSPVLFVLTATYSIYIIGPWAILGMSCYFLFYPIMGGIGKAQSKVRLKTVRKTDKRVSLMSEILNSLRLIKMYAWEDSFSKKIAGIRQEELKRHRIGALLQAVSSTMVPSISILATICTLLGYTLTGLPLKSSEAFTIYSLFNAMQFTVGVLPYTIRSIAEAKISLSRIQRLLNLPEHRKQTSGLMNNSLALTLKNATFAWEIHSINLKGRVPPTKDDKKKKKKKGKDEKTEVENDLLLKKDLDTNKNSNSEPAPSPKRSPNISTKAPESAEENSSPSSPVHRSTSEDGTIEITETLFGISLSVERGKLVGICGSVGAGKSSLISAVCGDMKLSSGQLQVNGRLALVTQQAWIYNSTMRENILVGKPYDEERYQSVIEACSLKSDFNQLPNGDLTEIGERGVNLSGGQKQRVNLARAVYSDRDIFLLDDPLSAVDTKVGKHIFKNCIQTLLSNKTVLLVSHGAHFLEECDEVILMKGGRICERGTHESLMNRKEEYYEMVGFSSAHKGGASADEIEIKRKRQESESASKDGDLSKDSGKLIKEEGKAVGAVSAKVYLKFIKVCGGWGIALFMFLVILVFTLFRIFNVIWLQQWLDAGDGFEHLRKENETLYNYTYPDDELKGDITQNPNLWIYQLVYGLSFIALIITGIAKGVGITFTVLTGSSVLHRDMFNSILRSPMRFLDVTPTGRILNRFSRDLDEVDVRVPFFLEFVIQGMFSIIGQIIMVCVIFPIFIVPLVAIAALFICIDIFLNAGVRELKRLDNTLKAPVIQHLGASISGLSVIRTFDREKIFIQRFNTFLDKHSASLMVFRMSNRWFTYRMDAMATLVTFGITTICVFTKGHFSTAIAGLALASVNGVCGFIPFFMRMKSECLSRFTSVERICEYAYELEAEAPREIDATVPPSSWPSAGAIEVKDIKLRYRPELPLVLHGLTFSVEPSEKIGIVGRTGAGKSSLITTILRIAELESGSITIDGVNISSLGLHTLRSAISVIPQDPVLFQGSIRYNLDPFDEHTDEAIWTAIERANLKKTINKLPMKLNSEVEAAGENFSVGERQLICLSRALLRNSKILLLDEATASVDSETDHLIQETIREAFVNCTVLTIAHRLNTISSYNRILVLHEGKVKEFGTPEELMKQDDSILKELMAAMGIHTVEQMSKLS